MPFLLLIFGAAVLVAGLLAGTALVVFLRSRFVVLMIAILGGLAVGGGSVGRTLLVSALLLVVLSLVWPKRPRRRQRGRNFDIEATATEAKPVPPSAPTAGRAISEKDETLLTAFAALAENADWARSRIAVVQESCRLFLGLADRDPFDNDAGDLAIRIRKWVPQHIGDALVGCELATLSERRAMLEEVVFTVEKVGAEADRQRARLMGPGQSALDVQRRHLTRGSDSFLD